jgi:hypothetical protein
MQRMDVSPADDRDRFRWLANDVFSCFDSCFAESCLRR